MTNNGQERNICTQTIKKKTKKAEDFLWFPLAINWYHGSCGSACDADVYLGVKNGAQNKTIQIQNNKQVVQKDSNCGRKVESASTFPALLMGGKGIVAENTRIVAERTGNVAQKTLIVTEKTGIVAERTGNVAEKRGIVSYSFFPR